MCGTPTPSSYVRSSQALRPEAARLQPAAGRALPRALTQGPSEFLDPLACLGLGRGSRRLPGRLDGLIGELPSLLAAR
jgi:hypothetical protein